MKTVYFKIFFILFVLKFSSTCLSAANSERPWVSLLAWARENNFKQDWTRQNETFALSNESWTLSFKVDSQLAAINGINVWLCEPILQKDGQVCISTLDLDDSLDPILFGPTNRPGDRVRTICLDPGHGGKDTGGVSGNYVEKHYTLPLADELSEKLKAAGFQVILTRTNDSFVELENRPGLANLQKADLFISLHFNVGPPGARGMEVYCLTPPGASSTNKSPWPQLEGWVNSTAPLPGNRQDGQNMALAYQLQKSLVENLRINDRGLRRARFAVLRTATMPAVLIEGGFLTDAGDQKEIADPDCRRRLAAAIVQGILNYQRLAEIHHPTSKPI